MNKKVIINADDFGITAGVNRGILEVINAGTLTSTSVMANMPWYKEVVHVKDRIGIGIHLTLTEGAPVLPPREILTLVNERGFFYDKSVLVKRALLGKLSKFEVKAEFEEQIKRLIELGIAPSHVDSHESFFKYPFFSAIVKEVANKFGIRAVRTYSPRKFDFRRLMNPKRTAISLMLSYQKWKWINNGFIVTDKIDSLLKFGLTYDEALQKLAAIFGNLPEGVLEIVVHPGYCDGDCSALGDYLDEREAELNALVSSGFAEIVRKSGARLISYDDVSGELLGDR